MSQQDYFEQFRGDPALVHIRIRPSYIYPGLSMNLTRVVYMPVDDNGSVYHNGSVLGLWDNVEFERHNRYFPDNPEDARQHAPNLCVFED